MLGQLTKQEKTSGSVYLSYDVSGKVIGIYADAAHTQLKLSYKYDEAGMRILKKDHDSNVETHYVYDAGGNVLAIYDNNGTALQQKEIPVYAAGRIGMYNKISNSYQYELTDHLGNVRVVLNQNKTTQGLADVVYYADYYPYGMPMGLASNDYRYGYQGQYAEEDKETAWNAFTLRNYDAAIGRWLSTGPYGQYASPYLGMGNNPVMRVDPDGGVDDWYAPEGGGNAVWIEGSGHQEGFKWLGGENFTFGNFALQEVVVSASRINKYETTPWMDYARSQLGVKEIFGPKHHPSIIEYHSTTGRFKDDETPWCASFVNWSLQKGNVKGTGSATAYSFKNYGIGLKKPAYGAIAVMNYSHVGFVAGINSDGRIVLLGGNQGSTMSDKVSSKNNWFYGSSTYGKIAGTEWGK